MSRFSFVSKIKIEKGWSGDEKYLATTEDGSRYLLRLMSPSKGEKFAPALPILRALAKKGVPMCQTYEIESQADRVAVVQRFVDGADAYDVIPYADTATQYRYGVQSGRTLRDIHSIPAPATQPDWESRFNAKMDRKIAMYEQCPEKFDGAEQMIDYINTHRHLLHGRPQCFQHGDYHIGNMMIEGETVTIIDFDRYDFGDPWEEFNRIVWDAQAAPVFAAGRIDGYFDFDVPADFWALLAMYIASNTLSSLPWAIPFGQSEIDTMRKQARDVLCWYDGMCRTVPT
ncbi:MAG: phosphotransferase [Clostridia bacterium]|nr:phosphotransferase [Clostridia bacterium]